MINQVFGRLTIVEFSRRDSNYLKYYRCICTCGNEVDVLIGNLKSGKQKSCGCLRNEMISTVNKIHSDSNTRLHNIWIGMKLRCRRQNAYKHLSVCSEWHDYIQFKEWALSNGYAENLTIDRINNSLGYSPENCRWATARQQALNRSNNIYIEYKGETKLLSEWSEILKIDYSILYSRLKYRGFSIERAFTQKVRRRLV